MKRIERGVGPLLALLLVALVPLACTPDGVDLPEPKTGSLSFAVTVPEGATEAWVILLQDDLRRSGILDVDPVEGSATGSLPDVPVGDWQALVLSGPNPDEGVLSAHAVVAATVVEDEEVDVEATLVPLSSIRTELTFNPSGPVFAGTGELNPFAVPRIREAMNLLLDRQAIADLVLGGAMGATFTGVLPNITASGLLTAEYRDVPQYFEAAAQAYAHDATAASLTIASEMTALGAQLVGGVWQYDGEPVTILLLIRNEDYREQIGDYVADLLEGLGFVTEPTYVTGAQATPIWFQGDPDDGLFHIYTGSWIGTTAGVSSDADYAFFFTPDGLGIPLWQAYQPTDALYEAASRLAEGDYGTEAERRSLLQSALTLSLEDSVRVFLVEVFLEAVFASSAGDVANSN